MTDLSNPFNLAVIQQLSAKEIMKLAPKIDQIKKQHLTSKAERLFLDKMLFPSEKNDRLRVIKLKLLLKEKELDLSTIHETYECIRIQGFGSELESHVDEIITPTHICYSYRSKPHIIKAYMVAFTLNFYSQSFIFYQRQIIEIKEAINKLSSKDF